MVILAWTSFDGVRLRSLVLWCKICLLHLLLWFGEVSFLNFCGYCEVVYFCLLIFECIGEKVIYFLTITSACVLIY